MSRFDVTDTAIAGVRVIERHKIGDSRGFLERVFCLDSLSGAGIKPVRQINRTLTRQQGAVRGMHFQYPPAAEVKLVTCLAGKVFDVAMDLRRGSETFGNWVGVELDGQGERSLLIPEGCAHGFQTLTPDCELLYVHSHDYAPEHESGVNPYSAGIEWPLDVTQTSQRDAALPALGEIEGIAL